MHKLNCTVCGAEMYGNKNRLYCDDCRRKKKNEQAVKRRNTPQILTCPICGKDFKRHDKQNNATYCSPNCAREGNRRIQKRLYEQKKQNKPTGAPVPKPKESKPAPKPKKKKILSLSEAARMAARVGLSYGEAESKGLFE